MENPPVQPPPALARALGSPGTIVVTEQIQERALAYMRQMWGEDPVCPMCEHIDWAVLEPAYLPAWPVQHVTTRYIDACCDHRGSCWNGRSLEQGLHRFRLASGRFDRHESLLLEEVQRREKDDGEEREEACQRDMRGLRGPAAASRGADT